MKKQAFLLPIATLILIGAGATATAKPIEVKAEADALSSEVSEQEPIESSETSKPTNWEEIKDVKVEGKSLQEWIEGLKNEETRRQTIIALILAVGGVAFLVIKWLTERGILKRSEALANDTKASLDEIAKLREETEKGFKEKMEQASAELNAKTEELAKLTDVFKELVEKDGEERQAIRKALLQMSQDGKDFVAAGTYKKIRSYLEEKEDGEI